MGRLLLAVLVGLVGALIVHIGVIFVMPRVAEDNAWARLAGIMRPFEPAIVAPGAPQDGAGARFGFLDPAFLKSACRFSLSEGPVRLVAESSGDFWSASINARSGDNLYSLNERLALEGRLDLTVGTQEQFETARLEGLVNDDESIPVVVPASEFYLTLRGLVSEASRRPFVERFVRSLTCVPVSQGVPADVVNAG